MATFDVKQTTDEGYVLPWPGSKVHAMSREVDFTVAANQLAQNKIMSIFKVPADVIVLKFGMKVKTADTDVTTVNLGAYTETDAGVITAVDADGYGVNLTLASTGYVEMDVDAAYNAQGASAFHVLAAKSHLTITNVDADTINDAVVEFFAVVVDVSA